MYRIIDSRSSGKTSRLMLLAKENNGVIACSNPAAMREKSYAYGIVGIDFISYYDLFQKQYETSAPVFIDEIEQYVKYLTNNNLKGYTLSAED